MKEKVKNVIGLQIFSNEIRAVQVTSASDKLKVSAYGSARLPEGTVMGGIIAKPEVFMSYLRELLTKFKFTSRKIILSISNQGLIVRYANFPKVSEDKQRNVIMLQAQNYIPIPLTELELAYCISDEHIRDEAGNPVKEPTISALLVAAKRDMLYNMVDTIQDKKYGSYVVEDIVPTVTTIASVVQRSAPFNTYMVMNANNDVINILIISGGKITLARSVQIDSTLSDELNRSERIEPDKLSELIEIIKNEFWSSVNYYRISNGEEVEALYLSSQVTELFSARPELAADLGVEVEIFTMAPYIVAASEFPVEKYAACICAALG
ncbi:MAG TPA: pilus assembly protein PilM [Clostridiales bacterium]|mgnify:FL=1|nr:pilus assembly protein PilM [Clostridiales bacterium]